MIISYLLKHISIILGPFLVSQGKGPISDVIILTWYEHGHVALKNGLFGTIMLFDTTIN